MVRRGTDPGRGLWSVPGGRTEPGETSAQAAVREVAEETGLRIVVEALAGTVERAGPGGVVYVIDDFVAVPAPGVDPSDVRAGDDADEVRWVGAEELGRLSRVDGLVDGLVEALSGWDLLPRTSRAGGSGVPAGDHG
jgi:8-oxo-dGTP diphosphatase